MHLKTISVLLAAAFTAQAAFAQDTITEIQLEDPSVPKAVAAPAAEKEKSEDASWLRLLKLPDMSLAGPIALGIGALAAGYQKAPAYNVQMSMPSVGGNVALDTTKQLNTSLAALDRAAAAAGAIPLSIPQLTPRVGHPKCGGGVGTHAGAVAVGAACAQAWTSEGGTNWTARAGVGVANGSRGGMVQIEREF